MVLSLYGRGVPPATDRSAEIALAERIAASSARFVILLEDHLMETPYLLLEDGPRKILTAANIRQFFGETRSTTEYQGLPLKVRKLYEKHEQHEQQDRAQPLMSFLAKEVPDFSYHEIGASTITFEEAGREYRERYGFKTQIDTFMFRTVKSVLNLKTGEKLADHFLFEIAFELMRPFTKDGTREKHIEGIVHFLNDKANQNLVRSECKQQGISLEELAAQVLREWIAYTTIYFEKRTTGKSDEYSVKNLLDLAHPHSRSILLFGLEHGNKNNTPASMPDQLQAQLREAKQNDQSAEIILLVNKELSKNIYDNLLFQRDLGILKTDITVYDAEQQRDYPILVWIEMAPSMYRWDQQTGVKLLIPRPEQL